MPTVRSRCGAISPSTATSSTRTARRWNVAVGDLGSPRGARLPLRRRRRSVRGRSRAADRRPDDRKALRLPAARATAAVSACAGLAVSNCRRVGSIHVAAAENDQVASRDRPIGISVPLGRPLGDIVGAQALAMRPDRRKTTYRRYVWAVLRDIAAPLDVTTRRSGVLQLPRPFAAHAARPSELCDERELLRRRAWQSRRGE